MSVVRDAAAWLALLGLVHLATPAMVRWLTPTPVPVCRLLALVPVGLSAYAATAWGLPPHPLTGPIEAMGTAWPLGTLGWLLGGLGWLTWASGRLKPAGGPPPALWLRAMAHLPLLAWPYTLLPPWAIDETIYHLGLPMHARVTGQLAAPLGHGNGGFYALSEWVGAWSLAMGSVSAARGVQLLTLTLGAQAALSVLAPPAQRRWAIAWLTLLASPVALWQLSTSYVDLVVTSFVGVTALCAAHTYCAPSQSPISPRACGLLLGAAIATKPTAAVLLPMLAYALPHRTHRSAAVTCALLVPLPFAAYNLAHYHTPLFPFSAPWWPVGEALLPAQREVLAQFFDQHGPTLNGAPLEGIMRFLLLPWGLFYQAQFASPCFDGVLGAAPLLVCGWAMIHALRPRDAARHLDATVSMQSVFWRWAAVLLALWLATSWQARFLLPSVYVALLAFAFALPPGRLRPANVGLILAVLAAQLAYWPRLRGHVPPLPIARLSTDASRTSLRRQWSAQSLLCEGPKMATARVALVWSQRQLFYCPQTILSDSYDEGARLDGWLSADDGAQRAAHELQRLGVTDVIVNESLWQSVDPRVSPIERARAQHIAAQWQALKRDGLQQQAQIGDTLRFQIKTRPRI